MTLTEALKQGDLVRRRSWPWWKCLNNGQRIAKQVWEIEENPRDNGWASIINWEDAIAEDWENIKELP